MRALWVILVVAGVLAMVAAIAELNVRETAHSSYGTNNALGLCGSIIQGPAYDDGGASHVECGRNRHNDSITAVALLVIALVAIGAGTGLLIDTRRSRPAPARPAP